MVPKEDPVEMEIAQPAKNTRPINNPPDTPISVASQTNPSETPVVSSIVAKGPTTNRMTTTVIATGEASPLMTPSQKPWYGLANNAAMISPRTAEAVRAVMSNVSKTTKYSTAPIIKISGAMNAPN